MVPAGAVAAGTLCATHLRGHPSVSRPSRRGFPAGWGSCGCWGERMRGEVSLEGDTSLPGVGASSTQGHIAARRWHCRGHIAAKGDPGVGGTTLLRGAEVETGQPSPGKSPAGEKCKEREIKIAPFLPAAGVAYRAGARFWPGSPSTQAAAPGAPSPRWGAGTGLLTLCPAFLALFSFFLLLLHPGGRALKPLHLWTGG